jgi:hypothetical protein
MDVDPSKIPVGPILFEYGLPRFAQSLIRGRPKIVAIGSSTTAGEGNIPPYPERLPPLLQYPYYPNLEFTVVNQGNRRPGSAERASAVRYRRHRRETGSGDLAGRNECRLAKP